MRDLRSLGARLRALHALHRRRSVPRFDPMAAARRYAELIVRSDPAEARAHPVLAERGAEALAALGHGAARRRASCTLRPAPRQRAHRRPRLLHRLGIRAGRRSAARPGLRHGLLPARRAARRAAARRRRPRGTRRDAAMLAELTRRVQSADISLVSRAPRGARRARHRPAARIHRPAPPACCWRPTPEPRHTSAAICANSRGG